MTNAHCSSTRTIRIVSLIIVSVMWVTRIASAQLFTTVDLGTIGGPNSNASAVNASGQVVGYADTSDGNLHAYSWTAVGDMVDLGTVRGFSGSAANAMNAGGQVVGFAYRSGSYHAISWTGSGGMVDLGALGGAYSGAQAVNAGGQVVGAAYTSGGDRHAFSWTSPSPKPRDGRLSSTISSPREATVRSPGPSAK